MQFDTALTKMRSADGYPLQNNNEPKSPSSAMRSHIKALPNLGDEDVFSPGGGGGN